MSKQRKYNDYKSVWSYRSCESIKHQIAILELHGLEKDRFAHREDLMSSDRVDILEGILSAREKAENL